MAEVPVMINGMIYDKQWRTARPVVLYGMASYADREIGGGPIYPGQPPSGGGGGGGEHPAFPIWGPPGTVFPPGPGYPPVAGHPLPEPPTETPPGEAGDDGFVKPPPEGGGWGYSEAYGWMYKPQAGQAGPKR